MKLRFFAILFILTTWGCATATQVVTPTNPPTTQPTPTLPEPSIRVTHAPDPNTTAIKYFEAWRQDDYEAMYGMLNGNSKELVDEASFSQRYLDTLAVAAVEPGAIEFEILSAIPTPKQARVEYRITLQSNLFGDLTRENQMHLFLEDGRWLVQWDDGLVFPDLSGGNNLRILNDIPSRGRIYDRNGELFVGLSDAFAIGVIPAQIDPDLEGSMLESLSRAIGFPPEYISTFYADYSSDADIYIPLTDVDADTSIGSVSTYDAVWITPFRGRYYFDHVASQTLGFTSAIQPEEVTAFMRKGYMWTERVPRDGIELWAEPYLGGIRGGTLFLDAPDGTNLGVLGQKFSGIAYDVYTTLDKNLQKAADDALFGFNGAIVVLERDTGRILAMASSPGFNANLFEPSNYNALFTSPFSNPNAPLFNRATRGQYPLGSVFKIITLATALESGRFSPESTYQCEHEFTELGNPILYDWTYWDELPPSGNLTLPEGLMRSCNPWFWHISLDLFNTGLTTAIADMAKGFGLGDQTGIIELSEESGQVLVPGEKLAATNLAIGQGDLLVTPLQVARFIAAIGNGGTLYRPQVIEKIVREDGAVVEPFSPEANGTLPITSDTLLIIQQAMTQVIRNPRGTAFRTLGAFARDIAGKTSTSETGIFDPDAWFVAYSFEENPDKPDIAVVAIVEQVGEGADFAAPIVRRVLETYFFGSPRSLYPWELRLGVPKDLIPEEEPEEDIEPTATPQDSGG